LIRFVNVKPHSTAIVVVAFNRVHAVERPLASLGSAEYPPGYQIPLLAYSPTHGLRISLRPCICTALQTASFLENTTFMNLKVSLLALAPLALLVGCSKNPAENVPAAKVEASSGAEAKTAETASVGARTFAFGTNGSSIQFVGSKVTGKHDGGFRNFAGELNIVNGRVADTGNKVVIDTTSLWTDTDRLTGHLKSPDFFGVAKFPTATFTTTSVQQNTTNWTVTGNLTLHGITKQISFPANIEVSDGAVTTSAQFFLNRFDFEMKYPGKADDLIRQEVVLKLKIKAAPGKADFQSLEKPAQTASTR
jgi:polyisoprenoid-binding protein YceI